MKIEMYCFDEALKIMQGKHENYTADELKFLMYKNQENVHMTDLPYMTGKWEIKPSPSNEQVGDRITKYHDPLLCFIDKEYIDRQETPPCQRFIYNHSLTKRNWSSDQATRTSILLQGGKAGLLFWYEGQGFGSEKLFKAGKETSVKNWAETNEGIDYANNPQSFWLAYNIIDCERILLGRSREECLKELGIKE